MEKRCQSHGGSVLKVSCLLNSLLHGLLLILIGFVVDASDQDVAVVVDLDLLLGVEVLENEVGTGILLCLCLELVDLCLHGCQRGQFGLDVGLLKLSLLLLLFDLCFGSSAFRSSFEHQCHDSLRSKKG